MEKENPNVFRTCRNYKKGIYIFNLYKKSDFIIMLTALSLGIAVLFIGFSDPGSVKSSTYLAAIIIGIPAFLTLPLEGYHAMYYRLYYLFRYLFEIRFYVWAGRKYLLEEESDEDL